MAELPVTVTADDIRRASWCLSFHLNNGRHGHQYVYKTTAFPEMAVNKGWALENGRRTSWNEFRIKVGADQIQEVPIADLDEAARLVSKVRRQARDDLEWEAADPGRGA